MYAFVSLISAWAIPIMIVFIPLYAAYRKVPVYESFVDGAKEGFDTAIKIIPHLVGMMVAISVFRASGAMDLLIGWMRPFFESIGVPTEVLPLAILRPITGAGSLGFYNGSYRAVWPRFHDWPHCFDGSREYGYDFICDYGIFRCYWHSEGGICAKSRTYF